MQLFELTAVADCMREEGMWYDATKNPKYEWCPCSGRNFQVDLIVKVTFIPSLEQQGALLLIRTEEGFIFFRFRVSSEE
jgi:hypothetical protein